MTAAASGAQGARGDDAGAGSQVGTAARAIRAASGAGAPQQVRPIPARRLALLWAATVVALAVHNLEEVRLDLTGWAAERSWLPGALLHGGQAQLAIAVAVVTAVVLMIAAVAVLRRPGWSAEVLTCLAWALIVNATSHLVLSVLTWSLMPGAVTALVLFLPLGVMTVRLLPRVQLAGRELAVTIAAILGLLAGALTLAALLTAVW